MIIPKNTSSGNQKISLVNHAVDSGATPNE